MRPVSAEEAQTLIGQCNIRIDKLRTKEFTPNLDKKGNVIMYADEIRLAKIKEVQEDIQRWKKVVADGGYTP